MFPMLTEQDDATIDFHCHTGAKYPSHRAHAAAAKEATMRERMEQAVSSVDSELA